MRPSACRLAPFLLAFTASASAADTWGDVAAGVLVTTGNTQTRTLNGKATMETKAGAWHNAALAQGSNVADHHATTAEHYLATDKLDYTFLERWYAFADAEWEKDLFGGIRDRTSETLGLGRHFLTGPVHVLDAEVGAGARQTRDQDSATARGQWHSDAIARAAGHYRWAISETSDFTQDLKMESGRSNTFTESVTALKLAIVGNLFAVASYTVRHNSQVPAGADKTDTLTALNLNYSFGQKPE